MSSDGHCCSNCGADFGYDIGWDDPPKGEGHIEVTWNPSDEPSFVVGETRQYCSIGCLTEEADEIPLDYESDETPAPSSTGTEHDDDLVTDGGDERPPFVDPLAEVATCYFCSQTWEPTAVDGFDLSSEDEYYPKMVPVCPEHAGGCR